MWHEILVVSEKYLVKYRRLNGTCVLYLTNLINVWAEELSRSTLVQRCKEQNPLIEADDESLIQHIFSLLEVKHNGITFLSCLNGEDRTLELKTKLAGVPFNFIFNLKVMGPEVLFQEVTRPLLALAHQLTSNQNVLCELLEAKDAEIAEYKAEGAQVKRRKLETTPFKRDAFIGSNISLSSVLLCLELVGPDLKNEDHCTENGSGIDMFNRTSVQLEGASEVTSNSKDSPERNQESLLSTPLTMIKEEPAIQTDTRNIKKPKPVNKPKLRL